MVQAVDQESEDAVTEQYSILFISAGVCVVVFVIFLGILCFRYVLVISFNLILIIL